MPQGTTEAELGQELRSANLQVQALYHLTYSLHHSSDSRGAEEETRLSLQAAKLAGPMQGHLWGWSVPLYLPGGVQPNPVLTVD